MTSEADVGYAVRQRINDAALAVQMHRAKRATEWSTTGRAAPGVEVVTGGLAVMRERLQALAEEAREILSIGVGSPQTIRKAHEEGDRRRVLRGCRMLSLVDAHSLTDETRAYLASLDHMAYYECFGPVQIKVFNRRTVALEGPLHEDLRSLLLVTRAEVVLAAMGYINEVRRTAVPLGKEPAAGSLTLRQRSVADRMQAGARDEQIADDLGISVRTVRSEIAALMEILGASNRFAAGVRYASRLQEPADQ